MCVCMVCLCAGFVCVCLALYVRSLGLALGNLCSECVCVFICRVCAIFMHLFFWVCICVV